MILDHVFRYDTLTGRLHYPEVREMRDAVTNAYQLAIDEKPQKSTEKVLTPNPFPHIFRGVDSAEYDNFEKLLKVFPKPERKDLETDQDINFIYTKMRAEGRIVATPSVFKDWLKTNYEERFSFLDKVKDRYGETAIKISLYSQVIPDTSQ